MKRWQSILLGLVITVITLYYAFHSVTWESLKSVLPQGRYGYVLIGIGLTVIALVVRAFRWRSMLNQRMNVVHSFHILTASYLFYNILPFRLGEIVRMYLPTRLDPPVPVFTSLSSVVLERVLDVLAVVVVAILAFAIAPVVAPEVIVGTRVTGLIAVIGIVVLVVFAVRRAWAHQFLAFVLHIIPALKRFNLETLLDRTLDGFESIGSVRGMLAVLGWTAISWIVSALITYVMLFVFFDHPTWNAALLALSVGSLSLAVPAAPGNVGTFEGAVVFGLVAAGFVAAGDPTQQTQALASAVLMHVIGVVTPLILGLYGLGQEHISVGDLFESARKMASRSKNEPVPTSAEG